MCYWSSVPTFVNSSDLPSRVLQRSDQVERQEKRCTVEPTLAFTEWLQISLSCLGLQAGAMVRYSEVGQFFRLIAARTCTSGVKAR